MNKRCKCKGKEKKYCSVAKTDLGEIRETQEKLRKERERGLLHPVFKSKT